MLTIISKCAHIHRHELRKISSQVREVRFQQQIQNSRRNLPHHGSPLPLLAIQHPKNTKIGRLCQKGARTLKATQTQRDSGDRNILA